MIVAFPIITIPLRTDNTGVIRVGNTRVTLDTIVEEFKRGESAESIAENFSAVSLRHIYAVIAFYLSNTEEVESYLAARAKDAARIQNDITSTPHYQQWRNRLLEYRAAKQK